MEREKKDDFLLLRFIICYSRIYILYFSFFVSLLLEEYGVIGFELNCSNGMYMELMEDTFGITSNGNLKLDRETWLTQDTYCVDMLFDKQDNCKEDLYALICFPERIENNIRWETFFHFMLSRLIVSRSKLDRFDSFDINQLVNSIFLQALITK